MNITVKTLNGERSEESVVIDGLEVGNGTKFNSNGKWIRLPKTYSKEKFSIGWWWKLYIKAAAKMDIFG